MSIKSNKTTTSHNDRAFSLPSAGIPYLEKYGSFDQVKVRGFSYDTESILITNYNAIEKLMRIAGDVIINIPKKFDMGDLLYQDLVVVLALARGLTYGENYSFTSTCDLCDHHEKHTVLVPDELPVKDWKKYLEFDDPVLAIEKDTEIILNFGDKKDVVTLEWQTLGNELKIIDFINKQKSASQDDNKDMGALARIASNIKTVNGGAPDNLLEAIEYVKDIRGTNKVILDEAIDKSSCGIDFTYQIRCEKCDNEYEMVVPFSSDFFRRG